MKRILIGTAFLAAALGIQAQPASPLLPPGELAVFKGGDSSGIFNISVAKAQPCFVQIFDTTTTNQLAPLVSVTLPTNGPGSVWINAHAGSEGGGMSRTTDRQFLALEGYTGALLDPTSAKPSALAGVTRGIVTLDAFTNFISIYSDPANWFGLPPGVTQNNPTGIASTDGTNFWGTGNVTGTSFEAAGTLFFNRSQNGGQPAELQNFIQAASQARIIDGTLYVVVQGQGVYNFVDPENNDAVVPLPFDPNVPNPVEHLVLTNLFINTGTKFKKINAFDMNVQGTVAYGADETFGVVKFINNAGVWSPASYFFSATNIGTLAQASGNQGCFGICVDFSGTNPVIYATTMENGTVPPNNSQGNPNQNRLIRLVDTGVSPGTNLVAQTLATAGTTNENLRGVDFSPDLRPLVTQPPANYATTNGGSAPFGVAVDSVFTLNYQWQQNGTNLDDQTNATLVLNNLDTSFNGFTYQCVVSNQYGVVTSAPPALLTVTATAVAPTITNTATAVTAFVNGNITFAPINPTGTEPLSFQWYHGGALLTDDTGKYDGSASDSLTISNLTTADDGNYTLVATNAGGFASNIVDVLTVSFHPATIDAGTPASLTTFVGLTASLPSGQAGGTPPFTNQWFFGTTSTKVTNILADTNEISGSAGNTLTIGPARTNDSGFYKLVISNGAGPSTSQVAQVTVLIPPPLSSVSYSNQTYVQNFDSLPDPGTNSVNSINNPNDPGSIDGDFYSLANPFDFTFPVINNNFVGGLGLSNTMPGWYGCADLLFPGVDGISRFGAQDGDQTTGGVIDFGPNDGNGIIGTNRALGLLSTSTTGATSFALKLINTSTTTLNFANISFTGELWHHGTGHRMMQFGYTVDPTTTNFLLTSEAVSNAAIVPGLFFSFPVTNTVTTSDGTDPGNQVKLATNNLALSTPWTPGSALWLIWGIDFFGSGSGNGYAIDNLNFSATATQIVQGIAPILGNAQITSAGGAGGLNFGFSFTNISGASFSVYGTTNLAPPVAWKFLGHATETPETGFSLYNFSDAETNVQHYYQVTSP